MLALSIIVGIIYNLVCYKTITKFTFRRYKHSKLSLSLSVV